MNMGAREAFIDEPTPEALLSDLANLGLDQLPRTAGLDVAELIRRVKADAWFEGHTAGWTDRDDDFKAGWVPSSETLDTPNPYTEES